jgi:hypothetical protein
MVAVTLTFPSIKALKQFNEVTDAKYVEINLNDLTISCTCCPEEVTFAMENFGTKQVLLN